MDQYLNCAKMMNKINTLIIGHSHVTCHKKFHAWPDPTTTGHYEIEIYNTGGYMPGNEAQVISIDTETNEVTTR